MFMTLYFRQPDWRLSQNFGTRLGVQVCLLLDMSELGHSHRMGGTWESCIWTKAISVLQVDVCPDTTEYLLSGIDQHYTF